MVREEETTQQEQVEGRPQGTAETTRRMTDREAQVLEQLCRGLIDKEIGHVLGISCSTVRAHLESLMRRFYARNRVGLVVRALKSGAVDLATLQLPTTER
jgi:DNA-binding NarL/FixJ family response regulator